MSRRDRGPKPRASHTAGRKTGRERAWLVPVLVLLAALVTVALALVAAGDK